MKVNSALVKTVKGTEWTKKLTIGARARHIGEKEAWPEMKACGERLQNETDLPGTVAIVEEILEKYTGDCDECWFYTYSSSADQIEELQINKAIQISNHQVDINCHKEKIKILSSQQDDLRDSIIEKEKKEKETADSK